MERYEAHSPQYVTPPAPRALTDEVRRWYPAWRLSAEARVPNRSLDVSKRPGLWRSVWIAARSAVVPVAVAVCFGTVTHGWRGIAPAAVFAAFVAGLSGVFLGRRRPAYWDDRFNSAARGMRDGIAL